MMQPARQIFAITPGFRSYLYSADARRSRPSPCAYDVILLAYSAARHASIRRGFDP